MYAQNQHVFTSPASPSPSPSSSYNPTYIIDHHKDISSQLQSHLKRFTLRSKVSISDVSSDYNVYQLWGPGTDALWGQFIPQINVKLPTGSLVPREGFTDIGFRDTRAPGMGVRVVLPQSKSLPALVGSSFIQVEESDYECKRILTGIPEGPKDFISGSSLPLESNLDIMNGGMLPTLCSFKEFTANALASSGFSERLLFGPGVDYPHISSRSHPKANLAHHIHDRLMVRFLHSVSCSFLIDRT